MLVHGGFVDGSGWEGVYQALKRDGYDVSVVQNPTQSLAGDVAATHAVIDAQDKPVILVGHSYGGAVVTEAGNHPKVAGLVYITAFAPDAGEFVATLIANPAPGAPVPPILPPQNGFLLLDKAKFAEAFAADLDPAKAAFMADSQDPVGPRRAERRGHRSGLEGEAELVSGREGRLDDPAGRPARHVETCGFHRRRTRGKPRDLRVSARRGGRADRGGRRDGQGARELRTSGGERPQWASPPKCAMHLLISPDPELS